MDFAHPLDTMKYGFEADKIIKSVKLKVNYELPKTVYKSKHVMLKKREAQKFATKALEVYDREDLKDSIDTIIKKKDKYIKSKAGFTIDDMRMKVISDIYTVKFGMMLSQKESEHLYYRSKINNKKLCIY